jgi:hypothetical protein
MKGHNTQLAGEKQILRVSPNTHNIQNSAGRAMPALMLVRGSAPHAHQEHLLMCQD